MERDKIDDCMIDESYRSIACNVHSWMKMTILPRLWPLHTSSICKYTTFDQIGGWEGATSAFGFYQKSHALLSPFCTLSETPLVFLLSSTPFLPSKANPDLQIPHLGWRRNPRGFGSSLYAHHRNPGRYSLHNGAKMQAKGFLMAETGNMFYDGGYHRRWLKAGWLALGGIFCGWLCAWSCFRRPGRSMSFLLESKVPGIGKLTERNNIPLKDIQDSVSSVLEFVWNIEIRSKVWGFKVNTLVEKWTVVKSKTGIRSLWLRNSPAVSRTVLGLWLVFILYTGMLVWWDGVTRYRACG